MLWTWVVLYQNLWSLYYISHILYPRIHPSWHHLYWTLPLTGKKTLNCLPKNLITTVSLKHSFAWWTRHCWHPQFSSWFSSATTTDFQRNKRNRRSPSPLLNLNGAGVRVENCLLPLYVRNLHEWLQILGNVSSKGRIVGAIMSGNTARMKESLLLFLKQLWFSQNEMW